MKLSSRRTCRLLLGAALAAVPIVACGSNNRAGFVVDGGDEAGDSTTPNDASDDTEPGTDAEGSPDTRGNVDSGMATIDSGTATIDSGVATIDSGATSVDSGVAMVDSGVATVDSGVAPIDSGSPVVDSGSMLVDSSGPPDTGAGGSVFGSTCTAPTVYTDSFNTNPLNPEWQTIVGAVGYQEGPDSGTGTLTLAIGSPVTQAWIGARPAWANYTLSVPVRINASGTNGNGGLNFRMESAGAAIDSGQMYYAGITPTGIVLGVENGSWTQYATAPGTFATGVFYTLTVSATGNALNVSVSGSGGVIATVNYVNADAGPTEFLTGSFGFRTVNMGMSYGPVTVTCQ